MNRMKSVTLSAIAIAAMTTTLSAANFEIGITGGYGLGMSSGYSSNNTTYTVDTETTTRHDDGPKKTYTAYEEVFL